jgi:hypothetical protein
VLFMNHYRLLRDNKESGPYTQEEMIAKGFKPYDLIWVEGKSAGWRYPSEIAEIKAYAPVIEEQPYDRFYKKPVQQRSTRLEEKNFSSSFNPGTIKREEVKQDAPVLKPAYTIQPVVGKHIHVILPSGNTVNVTSISTKKEPADEKRFYQPPVEEKKSSFSESISAPYQTSTKENATPVIKEAEQKPKEINNYKSDYYNKTKVAAGFSWTVVLGLFVGVATLVGLGVMIGLSINSGRNNDIAISKTAAKNTNQVISAPVNANAGLPVSKEDKPADISQNTGQSIIEGNKELATNAVIKSNIAANTPVVKVEKNSSINKSQEPAGNPIAPVQQTVIPSKKPELVPTADYLSRHLNISLNGYKIGAFGGISDLQCTLANDSQFALDVVEVEVQYIQANDKIFKTEKISFKDIAPGSHVTITAPKSSRGVKVISKIISINPKEPALSNTTFRS